MSPKFKFASTLIIISLVLFSTFIVTPSTTVVQAQPLASTTLPNFEKFVAALSSQGKR